MDEFKYNKALEILLDEGIDKYHELEKKIIISMDAHNAKYRMGNERPFAAFMTNFFAEGLGGDVEAISMQELPLYGKDKRTIDKIKKDILESKFPKRKLPKYKSYNIDGFINHKYDGDDVDMFLEFKSEEKFSEFKMLMDYAKWRIYTYDSEKEGYFVYISTKRDSSKLKSFIKRSGPPEEIDFAKKANGGSLFHYKKMNELLPVKIEDKMESLLEMISSLEIANDFLERLPNIDNFENYEIKPFYSHIKMYGRNVLFSYKARSNGWSIYNIAKDYVEEWGKEASSEDNPKLNTAAAFFKEIKDFKIGGSKGSDASDKLQRQSTNWLLAIIDVATEHFNIEKKRAFNIKEHDRLGNTHGNEPKNYVEMKRTIRAIFLYGYEKRDVVKFAKAKNTEKDTDRRVILGEEDYVSKNNYVPEFPILKHKKEMRLEQFQDSMFAVFNHIKESFDSILIINENVKILKFKEKYETFLEKRSVMRDFEKIRVLIHTERKALLRFSKTTNVDDLRNNMTNVLRDLIVDIEQDVETEIDV